MKTSMPSITSRGWPSRATAVVVSAGVDCPEAVARDDGGHPGVPQDLRDRDACGAGADHEDLEAVHVALRQAASIDEGGERDYCRAVLVVVEDRDVERLLEPLLDLEAARGGDVLEVDAAERGGDPDDRLDDLVHVLGGQADREGVHVGELLEEHRLALHHRHGRLRADVAEAEHGRAVGHHRDRVRLDRVLEGLLAVLRDGGADARDTRRVGHREIVARLERQVEPRVDLATAVDLEGAVRDLDHLRRLHGLNRRDHLPAMVAAAALDGDLANGAVTLGLDGVDGHDGPTRAGDGGGDLAEYAAGPGRQRDAEGQRELCGGGGHRG
jgi:hypothetical protein